MQSKICQSESILFFHYLGREDVQIVSPDITEPKNCEKPKKNPSCLCNERLSRLWLLGHQCFSAKIFLHVCESIGVCVLPLLHFKRLCFIHV